MTSLNHLTYVPLRVRGRRLPPVSRAFVDLPDYMLRDVGLLDGRHRRRTR